MQQSKSTTTIPSLSKLESAFQADCINIQTLFDSPDLFRQAYCPRNPGTVDMYSVNQVYAVSHFRQMFIQNTSEDRPKLSDTDIKYAMLFNFYDIKILTFLSPSFKYEKLIYQMQNALRNMEVFYQPYGTRLPLLIAHLNRHLIDIIDRYQLIYINLLLLKLQHKMDRLRLYSFRFETANIFDSTGDIDAFIPAQILTEISSCFYIDTELLQMILFNSVLPPAAPPNPRPTKFEEEPNNNKGKSQKIQKPKSWFLGIPTITGSRPCFNWICKQAPCTGTTCTHKIIRPHIWDPSTTPAEKSAFEAYIQQGWL